MKMQINSTEDFQNVIDNIKNIRNKMAEIFNKDKNNVKRIDGSNSNWVGFTQKSVHEKYLALTDNYDDILTTLDIYVGFLQKTLDDYVALDKKINQNAENNDFALDVNS